MAKLYFRYGAMNSGKTANMLMVAHNYVSQDKNILVLKPSEDVRFGINSEIKSRAISKPMKAILIPKDLDLFNLIKEQKEKQLEKSIDAILVDEAQFLSKEQVRQLAVAVDEFNIPVLCYGLRCSYIDGELFEGSAALMYWAESIEELKNVCIYCKSKATKNLLTIDGIPKYEGNMVVMGDIEGDRLVFKPVCRKHYLNPPKV